MEITLDKLEKNKMSIIKKIKTTDTNLINKFLAMGITKGEKIMITKKSIFSDPIEVKIRSFNLSLRKVEAEKIYVSLEE